ncbi:hypothetical protein RSJ42_16925 [Methanosarcina hadiensis]|uniref:hypothetical protein n=1 Tax=Methanosarcina hadiensis TaxID=3078083 RepID=UPI003977C233
MEDLEEKTPRRLTLTVAARWVFGILFFMAYFGSLVERNYLGSIFLFLSVLILIPPISQTIEQKFNFTISGALRFALVVCLFVGFGITSPQNTLEDDALDNLPASVDSITASDVITSWSGSSTKNTETFHIPSKEWKISWKTYPGQYGDMNFQIYVYNSDGSLKNVAANVIGENSDYSIIRGSGDYYLTINTAQPYEITVESLN